jgi:hypothetical protein
MTSDDATFWLATVDGGDRWYRDDTHERVRAASRPSRNGP